MTSLTLNKLQLVAAQKPTRLPAVQQRRNKLAVRIGEQIELANAQAQGTAYAPLQLRSYMDKATGQRKLLQTSKRVKPWWFTAENGQLALSVRYGSRVVELSKNKWAVVVGSNAELAQVLAVLKTAVLAGELDAGIDAAANSLRDAFAR